MVSLYIRTFRGDICWLEYCLQSIHRNLRGWDEIIVCIPEGQEHHLAHLTTERKVICPAWKDDYIGQQVSKLQAHRHAKGDLILFVDSDLVFLPGADVKDLLVGDKPVIGKERYASPKDPAVRKWRPVVTKLFGQEPEWEYMGLNASSRLFHRSTLEAFERRFRTSRRTRAASLGTSSANTTSSASSPNRRSPIATPSSTCTPRRLRP